MTLQDPFIIDSFEDVATLLKEAWEETQRGGKT